MHDINGKPIERIGDQVNCPLPYPGGKPHGINKIVNANATLSLGDMPVAVEGYVTECGHRLRSTRRASVG